MTWLSLMFTTNLKSADEVEQARARRGREGMFDARDGKSGGQSSVGTSWKTQS